MLEICAGCRRAFVFPLHANPFNAATLKMPAWAWLQTHRTNARTKVASQRENQCAGSFLVAAESAIHGPFLFGQAMMRRSFVTISIPKAPDTSSVRAGNCAYLGPPSSCSTKGRGNARHLLHLYIILNFKLQDKLYWKRSKTNTERTPPLQPLRKKANPST